MSDEQLDRIDARLKRIEERLDAVERRSAAPPPIPRPPPQAPQEPFRPFQPPRPQAVPSNIPPPVRPTAIGLEARETAEFKFGAQVLPRVGAGVFLLGLLYLVVLAISRGLITPRTQWYGELALCAGFIVAGLIKRNEREDFGQVLIGVGSCGLYMSFGGAEAFKHLITSSQLVETFILLSLANLGFSWWRSSRSFWIIGILGGFAGALLPLSQHNLFMNGALQVCIVTVAALVSAHRRWFSFTALLYGCAMIACSAALFPIYGDEWLQIGFLYVDALICLAANAASHHESKLDSNNLLLSVCVFGVGILSLCVRDGIKGTIHLAILAAAVSLLALAFGGVCRRRLLAGAAGVVLLLCPYGFTASAMLAYVLLGIAMCGYAWRYSSPKALVVLWGEVGFSLLAYFAFFAWEKPWSEELALVLLGSVLSATAVWVSSVKGRLSYGADLCAKLGGGAIGTVAFLRAGFLVGMQADPLHRPEMSQIYAALILSYGCGVLLLRLRSKSLAAYGWCAGTYAALNYLNMLPDRAPTVPCELCILAAFGGLTLLLIRDRMRESTNHEMTRSLAVGIFCALFMRAGFQIGLPFDAVHRQEMPLVFTALIGGTVLGIMGLQRRSWVETGFAWALLSVAVLGYVSIFGESIAFDWTEELFMLGCAVPVAFLVTQATIGVSSRDSSMALAAVLLWGVFSRMAFLVLIHSGLGITDMAAVSVAWTVYAAVLIGVGFAKKCPPLRYLSLGLFSLTLGKVFLFDLAGLDSGVRVTVLMALGMALIAGGYGYVRARRRLEHG